MKETKKLYDNEPYGQTFTATILSAEKENGSWEIVLDQTLFFSEEGGQSADKGTLSGWIVEDVQIRDGVIYHKVQAPMSASPKAGMTVQGQIDWAHRFSNMQNHTGEHILSGLIHAKYGFENVGFHLSDNIITFDQSGYLTPEQVAGIEREANRVVWANLPVTAAYLSPAEAAKRTYRSKIEIDGDVRLVTIGSVGEDSPTSYCGGAGDGREKEQCFGVVDVCACCAPHVAHTGEIGLIKILRSEKYKGGTRLTILCGKRALEEVCKRQSQIEAISHLLRAKQDEADEAVQHLFEENAAQKERLIRMQEEKIQTLAEQADFSGENVWIFTEGLDPLPHRNLVNLLMERCEGYAGVFLQIDAGYRFIIGSRTKDSREAARILRESFGAKGGGKPEMVQGSIYACRDEIVELFRKDES